MHVASVLKKKYNIRGSSGVFLFIEYCVAPCDGPPVYMHVYSYAFVFIFEYFYHDVLAFLSVLVRVNCTGPVKSAVACHLYHREDFFNMHFFVLLYSNEN